MQIKDTTILSTKKLTTAQKELLLNTGIGLVEYNAIQIELVNDINPIQTIDHAIFTSKNAVKAIQNSNIKIQNCYCVGSTTQKVLTDYGCTVLETGIDATDLAQKIVKRHRDTSFLFFCGNHRRDELPTILAKHNVIFTEQIVYHTQQVYKQFQRIFDGILFFSPSAIQSYSAVNSLENNTVFCIGNTTASEAKKHTKHIIIANKSTIENVIVQAVNYFKQ